MKKTVVNRTFLLTILGTVIVTLVGLFGLLSLTNKMYPTIQTQTVTATPIGLDIVATGAMHSQQEATLHFQTSGKLVLLPFKEGDTVAQGQTIAQLDTYSLQRQLTQALNAYRSTRDTFDQTQANAQTGVLQNSQKSGLNVYNQSTIGGNGEVNAIDDAVKRIVDQNQANLDNSVITVELANYALQLSTLPAPFSGVITHEDVTVANQNITPVTSFSLVDPSALVFRADVDASSIDYVSVGAQATVNISGQTKTLSGTVIKIYPQKQILPSGQAVYEVDVQSQTLQNTAKFGQDGSVVIKSNAKEQAVVVPTWTIVGHNSIWVLEEGKAMLKRVTIGTIHGNMTEVLSGLNPEDKIITNPETIASTKYQVL